MAVAFESRFCPVCGTDGIKKVFAESNFNFAALGEFAFASRKFPEYMHYRLVECGDCNLLYSNPVPQTSVLSDLYHEAAFDSQEEASLASQTYGKMLPDICKQLPDLNYALDIGTGTGDFLTELKGAGFEKTEGVEPSQKAIDAGAPEIRALIRHGIFSRGDFQKDSLSLISCFQTLEHLPNPGQFCADAAHLLKEGGAVYFVMHNRNAVSARLLGLKSPIFDIEHLQLFCRQSAERLLRINGFERIEIKKILNTYPVHYWCKLFPFPAALKKVLVRIFRLPILRRLSLTIPAGNLAVIGFKRKKE